MFCILHIQVGSFFFLHQDAGISAQENKSGMHIMCVEPTFEQPGRFLPPTGGIDGIAFRFI